LKEKIMGLVFLVEGQAVSYNVGHFFFFTLLLICFLAFVLYKLKNEGEVSCDEL
jgi:hypothetical protein